MVIFYHFLCAIDTTQGRKQKIPLIKIVLHNFQKKIYQNFLAFRKFLYFFIFQKLGSENKDPKHRTIENKKFENHFNF
jgi:hypothetical protein